MVLPILEQLLPKNTVLLIRGALDQDLLLHLKPMVPLLPDHSVPPYLRNMEHQARELILYRAAIVLPVVSNPHSELVLRAYLKLTVPQLQDLFPRPTVPQLQDLYPRPMVHPTREILTRIRKALGLFLNRTVRQVKGVCQILMAPQLQGDCHRSMVLRLAGLPA